MRRRAQPALGTLVEISLYDDLDDLQSRVAFQAGFAAIHEIHHLMSFHTPDSDIGRYNKAEVGAMLKISTHTAAVLIAARRLHEVSDGLFDIRVARHLVEWGYLPGPAPVCSNTRNNCAEMYDVSSDGEIEKCSDDWLDLGGIAKGYAVDCAVFALQAQGVRHACVNAGGDLRVLGQAQTVLIRDPCHPQSATSQLQLADRAMATSASYFSRKNRAGSVLSALVHPITGKAIVDQYSYTVVAPNCLLADALTKVIAASGNVQHPCLSLYDAEAFII